MKLTILIVEDNRNSIYLLERILLDAGHRVWRADHGIEALDMLSAKGLPDLIVSDALMPRMDGFELCHHLRRDPARCHVPFVIYTATFTESTDEEFAHRIGADAYLLKPFDPERIAQRLEEVHAQVRARPPRRPVTHEDSSDFLLGHGRRMAVKLEHKVEELSSANSALAASEHEIRELNNRLVQTIRQLEAEVTQRKRTAHLLRLAQNVVAMGSFGFDFDQGSSWWTAEALQLLDCPPGTRELRWESLASRLPVALRAAAAAVFAPDPSDPQPREVEFSLTLANGAKQILFARSERVQEDEFGARRRIGVVRDISIRRQAEADRLVLERRLRQSQKMEAIGKLAGGIAHDFNNILAVIAATSELLELDARQSGLGERWLSGMQDIRTAAARARDLVGQILLFSRNEGARREAVNLAGVITDIAKQFTHTLPAHIVVSTRLHTDRAALANASQIHQILLNLCTNSRHAIGNRPGEIVLSLGREHLDERQAARRPPLVAGEYLRLEVSDNGCGMDEETVQRVFEPFFSTKPAGEGTGLGLAVVHGIMTGHEGAIFVESTPGLGTTFTLFIPAAPVGVTAAPTDSIGPELPRGAGQRVLVVDDEPAVAKVAASMLTRLGYLVEVMNDSAAARDRLLREPLQFDFIVTDYFMPRLTGLDFARAVWARHPGLPMVMIVGFGGQMDAARAHAQGFRAFVSKPFTLQALAEAARSALSA